MAITYIKNKNYIQRGSRCYGIPISDTSVIFIRGIRSWPLKKLREFLATHLHNFINNILSVKRITQFNYIFFRIRVLNSNNATTSIVNILKSNIKKVSVSYNICSRKNHKFTFSTLKRKIQSTTISPATSQTTITLTSSSNSYSTINYINSPTITSTNLNQSTTTTANFISSTDNRTNSSSSAINHNSSAALINIPQDQHFSESVNSNSNSENINQDDFFPFALVGIRMDGTMIRKIVSNISFQFIKLLLLCFQETGNGTGTKNNYPCKVKIPNYKYFLIKADETIPGKRRLFIGYHKSCQASQDSSSYEYIVSIITYSLWNCSECSIGNIYAPQRRHTIFVQHAKLELIS